MRKLVLILVVLLVVGGVGAYVAAGFVPGPSITITKPQKFAGASIPLELEVGGSGAPPAAIAAFFEQNGTRTPVFTANASGHVTGTIGLNTTPGLKIVAGPAKVIVTATTKVWGLREATTQSVSDITIRLEKPRVSVVPTKHYINLGGSPERPEQLAVIKDKVGKILKAKPKTPVLVWGDEKVPYGIVVVLMSELQQAGW